jgi:hypothetical protein
MRSTHSQWVKHIEDWKICGLTQAEYCRRKDLKQHVFTYWKKRLLERADRGSPFVQLPAVTAPPPLLELRVTESGKLEIRFNVSFAWTGSFFS